jgi:hypothetical protein
MFDTIDRVLTKALSLKRCAYSQSEMEFSAWFAVTYGATMIDHYGNLHFDRRTGRDDKTLFTCHSDTVHRSGGVNSYSFDPEEDFYYAKGDVLGADDAAGLALVAWMITCGVPGYYIVFRGEEVGGVGSRGLADTNPDLLRQFNHAVAFDRADYYDIITHQAGDRCCSDGFAQALADKLADTEEGLMFLPSDQGVYTDTAEFVGLIPECTNISVGYFLQHSGKEKLDAGFLKRLAASLVEIDWNSLPVVRNAASKGEEFAMQASFEMAVDTALYCNAFYDLATLLSLGEKDALSWLEHYDASVLTPEQLDRALEMPYKEGLTYLKDIVMAAEHQPDTVYPK